MSRERFPIQDGPSVPWAFMAPHEAQARKNHGQTLEGLAERGGLGCAEAWVIVHGLKHMDILHEEHKDKWIELAERVNREWSIERLLAQEREKYLEALCASVCSFCALPQKYDLHAPLNVGRGYWCHTEKGVSPTWENKRCVAMSFRNVNRDLDLTAPSSTEEGKKG